MKYVSGAHQADQLRDARDNAEDAIAELHAEYAALEPLLAEGDDAAERRAKEIEDELCWLAEEVADVERDIPAERPAYSWS